MPNDERKIQRSSDLALNEGRQAVLDIVEAGLAAIDTTAAIWSSVNFRDDLLSIGKQDYDLKQYDKLLVIGVGKNADRAVVALSDILGNKVTAGLAIGLADVTAGRIRCHQGTHPLPSELNCRITEQIVRLGTGLTERDLVIVVVSGGGSSLLCWPDSELIQGERLYREFLKTGGTISELNTIRKHLSGIKGGGLAKILYPANVIGLIFSDVPGDHFADIASGPTYADITTVADAQAIIARYGLSEYDLTETPKEARYFENVRNIPLVANTDALTAMATKAQELGLTVKTLSAEMYDSPERVARLMLEAADAHSVILAAGEPRVVVTTSGGSGGRCQRVGMAALPLLKDGDCFAAIASDGLDNSDAAGIIEDIDTTHRLKQSGLDLTDHWNRFDGYTLYSRLGHELLRTGPTGSNVSDLFVLYRK